MEQREVLTVHALSVLSWYCHDWEEYSINKGKTATISIPNYTLQIYEEKRVVLKSRSSKRNDSEWVASNRILVFSQRFLGAPRGKHYNSLEIDVLRKAVSRSKETITKRDHRLFAAALSELEWVMLIQGKRKFCLNNHEIWSKMNRLTFHHAHGLLWNWHRVLVSKFRHISLFSFVYVC